MKRQNIEIVLGFLDAIRRRDGEAAAASQRYRAERLDGSGVLAWLEPDVGLL